MVHIAGFGLSIDDLKWIMIVLFVIITIVQFGLNPGLGFIPLLDKKVIGYPVCESLFCFAPSVADLNSASSSVDAAMHPKSVVAFAMFVATGILFSLWVVFKLIVTLMVVWVPLQAIMKWYGFWMPHVIN